MSVAAVFGVIHLIFRRVIDAEFGARVAQRTGGNFDEPGGLSSKALSRHLPTTVAFAQLFHNFSGWRGDRLSRYDIQAGEDAAAATLIKDDR